MPSRIMVHVSKPARPQNAAAWSCRLSDEGPAVSAPLAVLAHFQLWDISKCSALTAHFTCIVCSRLVQSRTDFTCTVRTPVRVAGEALGCRASRHPHFVKHQEGVQVTQSGRAQRPAHLHAATCAKQASCAWHDLTPWECALACNTLWHCKHRQTNLHLPHAQPGSGEAVTGCGSPLQQRNLQG